MNPSKPPAIERWHAVMSERNVAMLDDLLADDAVFHSPVVHTPQRGKPLVKMYLAGAAQVLGNDQFRYVREIYGANDAVLEFTTVIDGIQINGIDLIQWNDDHQITDFKVMLRPLKAVNLTHEMMGKMLQTISGKKD